MCSIPGLVAVTAMNMYSGALSSLTTVDTIKRVRPTFTARWISVLFITVVGTGLALLLPSNFLTNFNNFLLIVLYFMIPWTAVNLIDFFFVRKGNYAIRELFKPHGMYGAWSWRGLFSYLLGFAVMIPFFSTTIYEGPVAHSLDGGDISPFIGFPVAAIVYYLISRNIDVAHEAQVAQEQRALLEAEAHAQVAVGTGATEDLLDDVGARVTEFEPVDRRRRRRSSAQRPVWEVRVHRGTPAALGVVLVASRISATPRPLVLPRSDQGTSRCPPLTTSFPRLPSGHRSRGRRRSATGCCRPCSTLWTASGRLPGAAPSAAAARTTCSRLSREEIRTAARIAPATAKPDADEERPVKPLGQRDGGAVDAGAEQALGAAVGDRGEDREPERAADLLGGVDQPRGEPRLVRLGPGHGGDRHRHEREPEADGGQQRRAEHVGHERAARRRTCENQ